MNFLTAGIPLFRAFRIQVILSWMFLIYVAYVVFTSRLPFYAAIEMATLFGIVLLHEFGHCFACRAVKGRADHIVLWPLGGLAMCDPPNEKFANLVTTAGGPLVNVILVPILWGLLALLYRISNVPPLVYGVIESASVWNFRLLVFNLLPIYPMDGGRLFQEILWYIVGYQRSLMIAGMVGTVAGVGMAILGTGLVPSITLPFFGVLGGNDYFLIAIGIMAAMASFQIYQRSQEIAGWRKR